MTDMDATTAHQLIAPLVFEDLKPTRVSNRLYFTRPDCICLCPKVLSGSLPADDMPSLLLSDWEY